MAWWVYAALSAWPISGILCFIRARLYDMKWDETRWTTPSELIRLPFFLIIGPLTFGIVLISRAFWKDACKRGWCD